MGRNQVHVGGIGMYNHPALFIISGYDDMMRDFHSEWLSLNELMDVVISNTEILRESVFVVKNKEGETLQFSI
jgi:hypothetical protein